MKRNSYRNDKKKRKKKTVFAFDSLELEALLPMVNVDIVHLSVPRLLLGVLFAFVSTMGVILVLCDAR